MDIHCIFTKWRHRWKLRPDEEKAHFLNPRGPSSFLSIASLPMSRLALDSNTTDTVSCFWTFYKWNHTVVTLFELASFDQIYICKIHPCTAYSCRSFYSHWNISQFISPFWYWAFGLFPVFWLIWKVLLWTFSYKSFDTDVPTYLLDLYTEVGLLGHRICKCTSLFIHMKQFSETSYVDVPSHHCVRVPFALRALHTWNHQPLSLYPSGRRPGDHVVLFICQLDNHFCVMPVQFVYFFLLGCLPFSYNFIDI